MLDEHLQRCFPHMGKGAICVPIQIKPIGSADRRAVKAAVRDFSRLRKDEAHIPAVESYTTIELFASCVAGYGKKLQPVRRLYQTAIDRGLAVGNWNRPAGG